MDSFDNSDAVKCATVPNMDGWHLAELPGSNQVAIDITDRTTDDFLVVVRIVPLLADRRVEQNYCTADEVDELFVDVVGACLVLVALVARAFGS